MELENSKGTRDFPPEDKILRNEVVEKLRKVFERYGYSPLETPIIERYELLAAKGGVGQDSDAMKEIFTLTDQGGRKLGLKFEQTLSFARFIGMNPNLRMPFKRYETGPVFRDGPIKLGRYRQFWQCDVDVVGCKEMIIDAEIIALALDTFKGLGLDAYLVVNNRKLLRGIIKRAKIEPSLVDSVIISIDKLKKFGWSTVENELRTKSINEESIDMLRTVFTGSEQKADKSFQEKIDYVKMWRDSALENEISEGLKEIEEVFSYLSKEQKEKVVFDISLARGLGYYTGTIFEGFMRNSKVTSSICGGGRYDNLISDLLQSEKEFPCIGISFGIDVIADVMKLVKKESQQTVTRVFVIPIKTLEKKTLRKCFALCKQLRDAGINADMDFLGRGISKNLNYTNSMNIPYVLIVGEQELARDKVKLRDMKSGKEELLSIKEVVDKLS